MLISPYSIEIRKISFSLKLAQYNFRLKMQFGQFDFVLQNL